MKNFPKQLFVYPAAILGWLLLAPVVHASHPLITDDAGTVGKGAGQIEINAEFWHDRETTDDNGTLKGEGAESALSVTFGIGENLDLVAGIPYQWLSREENGEGAGCNDGLSDLEFDLKWRLFAQDGWGLALKPGITLPTGSEEKGLGSGRTAYRLFLIATRELEPWAFHLNLGYLRNENGAGERTDLWHASLATEVEVAKDLKAVANIGMERNPAPQAGTHPAFALGGLVYSLSEKISLDCGVKIALTEPETDVSYLFGLTYAF